MLCSSRWVGLWDLVRLGVGSGVASVSLLVFEMGTSGIIWERGVGVCLVAADGLVAGVP